VGIHRVVYLRVYIGRQEGGIYTRVYIGRQEGGIYLRVGYTRGVYGVYIPQSGVYPGVESSNEAQRAPGSPLSTRFDARMMPLRHRFTVGFRKNVARLRPILWEK